MSKQTENITLVDEIINNASELPLECQDWLLVLAKGMAYTKNCLLRQGCPPEQARKPPEERTA